MTVAALLAAAAAAAAAARPPTRIGRSLRPNGRLSGFRIRLMGIQAVPMTERNVSDLVFRDLDRTLRRAAPSTTRGKHRCARSSRSCARSAPLRASSRPPRTPTARRGGADHQAAAAAGAGVRPSSPARASTRVRASTTAGSNCVPAWRPSSTDRERLAGRLAIGPVGGHRLEGVGHEDDARLQRDLLAGQPVRDSRRRRSARGGGAPSAPRPPCRRPGRCRSPAANGASCARTRRR